MDAEAASNDIIEHKKARKEARRQSRSSVSSDQGAAAGAEATKHKKKKKSKVIYDHKTPYNELLHRTLR